MQHIQQINVLHDAGATAAARWRDFLAQPLGGGEVNIIPAGFAGTNKRCALGKVWIARVTAKPHSVAIRNATHRTAALVMIVLQCAGNSTFSQNERLTALTTGEWIMLDCAQPWSIDNLTEVDQIAVILPRDSLTYPLVRQSSLMNHRLPNISASFRIMVAMLAALTNNIQHIRPPNLWDMGDVVIRSVNATFAAMQSDLQIATRREIACERVKALIWARYRDPHFGVGDISQSLGMSKRNVHNVLKNETWTVDQHIRHIRMARAQWMIGNVDAKDMPISTIAYSSGFRDLSQFSHLFRVMFGTSPSHARKSNTDNQQGELQA